MRVFQNANINYSHVRTNHCEFLFYPHKLTYPEKKCNSFKRAARCVCVKERVRCNQIRRNKHHLHLCEEFPRDRYFPFSYRAPRRHLPTPILNTRYSIRVLLVKFILEKGLISRTFTRSKTRNSHIDTTQENPLHAYINSRLHRLYSAYKQVCVPRGTT